MKKDLNFFVACFSGILLGIISICTALLLDWSFVQFMLFSIGIALIILPIGAMAKIIALRKRFKREEEQAS